jgi:hypothetical protein
LSTRIPTNTRAKAAEMAVTTGVVVLLSRMGSLHSVLVTFIAAIIRYQSVYNMESPVYRVYLTKTFNESAVPQCASSNIGL